ncbi:6-phosphofructokinase 1 [Terrimicrobium sacchariphilum]|uniref:ATP-dependent 6-phosphofructokinase n=1 Tax=Terrimicrobium sacchariphilum TaxID=690879 RepID=A0A146G2M7_TERSA|nr:ATP-dependent 6-phosphofructokinase [Terrimicrobium sacchariphilum]GAT32109.1 6-phosphofructokinase 1 [Terrimicrobium sacchariphilum]
MPKTRIGVLTSGGDCPGLNAVIRGVCRAADKLDWEVIGFRDGYEGLLPPGDYFTLDRRNTSGIMHLGGTILGTTNRGHFVAKVGAGDKAAIPQDIIDQAKQTFHNLGLTALVCIGGDGSLSTALQLFENGIPVIGVPKTIDNDLEATAMTFGFDSAVACVADALDRLHTTATSHKRVMVLEVMGRNAGWIALHGGLAGGADVILIPEIPFSVEKVAEEVLRREKEGAKSTMIVVAEGAAPDGKPLRHAVASGEHRLGGVGDIVGKEIADRTDKEVRTCILGHLQRGGAPTTLDRILGTRFGVKAVQLIEEKKFGTMVSYQNYLTLDVPISHAVHKLRRVTEDSQLVSAARAVGISFGD